MLSIIKVHCIDMWVINCIFFKKKKIAMSWGLHSYFHLSIFGLTDVTWRKNICVHELKCGNWSRTMLILTGRDSVSPWEFLGQGAKEYRSSVLWAGAKQGCIERTSELIWRMNSFGGGGMWRFWGSLLCISSNSSLFFCLNFIFSEMCLCFRTGLTCWL